MDNIDLILCQALQKNARLTSADLGEIANIPASTAHDRVRKLAANGFISEWRAILDPQKCDADFCAFLFLDMSQTGETEAVESLIQYDQIMELHHISGSHSYLAKIRTRDLRSFQDFLTDQIKPLGAIQSTLSTIVLKTEKESSALPLAGLKEKE